MLTPFYRALALLNGIILTLLSLLLCYVKEKINVLYVLCVIVGIVLILLALFMKRSDTKR
jgi:hypothetical protein